MDNYSLADVATVMGRNDGGAMGGAWWLILLFLFLIGSNGFGFGGNRGDFVTSADLNSAIAGQTSALNQQQILLSSANNNYETARLIDNLGVSIMSQNNTNLVNAIQGFNVVNQNLTAGFNSVNQSICNLGYQLDKCCCDIKTQMLQNRLDDAQAVIVSQNGALSNAAQTQTILGAMGRWVGYPPVAAATTTGA